jgi:transposase
VGRRRAADPGPPAAQALPPGRKEIVDRLVLNGILHVLHTGIAWEDLPREYG